MTNGLFACMAPPTAHLKTLGRPDDEAASTGVSNAGAATVGSFLGCHSIDGAGFTI
jgi:hypothetical protein